MWKRILPIVRILVILLPFGGSWNVWISRIVLEAVYGGFVLSYIRNVEWAPLSIFQSAYILVALAFTVICTTVTLYKMLVLPERLKAAEKSLCFTSIFISITFLLVAATQILWITCCVSDILYALQYLAFDSFTVGLATLLIPFCGTWNVWISRVYAFSTGSGFAMDYIKNVKWASLSMFQAIFIFTAFFFTITCTSITLYKLIILADRIKSAEKSLCFTSIFISCCFLIVGGIQITFVFCSACRGMEFYIMYMLSQWTFDVYNLGTAIVMILTNRQLRNSVFCLEHSDKNGTVSVSAAQNDNKKDNIFSSYLLLADIFYVRLFMYIPPLCPIIMPIFFNPSFIPKLVYATMNHCRFAKSIAQIFLVLNRMSCVLVPTDYESLWRKLIPIVRFLTAFLPFCGTWNIWISRIYVFPVGGGFAMDYIKNVEWAALSLFQSIFVLTALFFTIVCTSITLYKLIFLPDRMISAEKSLCFTSIFISCCFLIVGATQVAFVTCSVCRSFEYLYFMYMLSYYTFDAFNVG
ncbi:hypothetical protein B9Z55_006941 [Caenorhabditis nigoni]|nr:hypothetical protein B9Z55_006941 [Caenorhabditis nigoni]